MSSTVHRTKKFFAFKIISFRLFQKTFLTSTYLGEVGYERQRNLGHVFEV